MKKLPVFVFAVAICAAATVSAQPSISLFGDDQAISCNIIDTTPGFVEVHIFVIGVDGLAGIQFGAPVPACWNGATWVSDNVNPEYIFLGGTQESPHGISIATGCVDGGPNSPIYLGYMLFSTQGAGSACCEYPIVKVDDFYPEIDGPIMVLCDQITEVVGVFESGTINAEPDCGECLVVVPAEETSWGAIKALYGE